MEDPAGAAAELGRAALDVSFSATTTGVSVTLKIDNVVLAGIVSVGALSLGAYYLANRRPVENAIRNGLERRNEAGVVDPEVRNIEEGSIRVELHCQTEHSLIQFVKDFESRNVKRRLEKEFKRIGFSSELLVTMENANEVNKKVEEIRLSQKGSRTEKVEGGSGKTGGKMATGTHEAGTPDDEPMDDEHRRILRRCREAFVKDMDPVQVLREMVDPHLFSAEEEIKIKGNGLTREEQWENLLEILPRKGAKAYKTFQKTIAEIHPHLETTILKAEIRELKSELKTERKKSAGLQRRLSPVKRGQPTNDELEKLGTDIAGGWKILGRRLDFTCATIEEIDHKYPNLREKGFQMLLGWTQQEGSAATYQALCEALQHELVKRQDLAEKFCYANEKEFEVLQTDLDHARAQSDRMRKMFHDMTTGLGQKLETLEENVKSMHELLKEKADSKDIETRLQKIETPVKQSKDIQKSMKNSVKDDEEEEIKLGKQRDQIGDRELMQEERRKSFETSSESNYNSVLHETSSSENELAADITPDALEHDDFHVGSDRQKNGRFLDRATSPIQSESEC